MMTNTEPTIPFMESIYILGSGSIGLLFASSIRLAFPSYPLTMLLRPHHEPRLQSLDNRSKYRRYMEVCIQRSGRPCIVHLPAEIISEDATPNNNNNNNKSIRTLLLSTKAPDAANAVTSIRNRLDSNARIIILCNGALAVQEEVRQVLQGSNRDPNMDVHLASTTHGAFRDNDDDEDELYHVIHAGVGKTFIEDFLAMAKLWDQSGLMAKSISSQKMNQLLWQKLAANCVINPLTALLQCENGELLHQDLYRKMADPILEELANVAQQELRDNETTSISFPELQSFVSQVIHDTAHNKSSMLQDVMNKRQTEIDYLNGYVVQKGNELGLNVSANQEICQRVQEITRDFQQS